VNLHSFRLLTLMRIADSYPGFGFDADLDRIGGSGFQKRR
jgi:hypothetical protein